MSCLHDVLSSECLRFKGYLVSKDLKQRGSQDAWVSKNLGCFDIKGSQGYIGLANLCRVNVLVMNPLFGLHSCLINFC
eukprot:c30053_g1_i1 orf=2-232(-)